MDSTSTFYETQLCMKQLKKNPIKITNEHYVKDFQHLKRNLTKVCVLQKDHKGPCKENYNRIFKKFNEDTQEWKVVDRLSKSIKQAIYDTPGNDYYVFKNRASRLYPYALTIEQARTIRDKTVKKVCAIPKRDASTPLYLAESYLDWATFMFNIHDIGDLINNDVYESSGIKALVQLNKDHLIQHYKALGRDVFDKDGHSICVVTKRKINLVDVADPTRDIRTHPCDNDIQLGHNIPRSDEYITIKGCNLLPMSRRGNMIVGERTFTEKHWVDELESIVKMFKGKMDI